MTKDAAEDIKDAVKNWFSNEGIKIESLSNPRTEFLFKVKFMRFFFSVVRPNDKDYIQVESQVMISPQHMKKLTAEKMREFQIAALRESFSSGINMGFVQPKPGQKGPQPPGPGFVVSDRIYDDGFSYDRLWQVMRKVHAAVDMTIAVLNDVTGMSIMKPPQQEPEDTTPSYYT